MRVVDDWHRVLRRTWSVRCSVYLALLNGAVLGLAAFVDVLNPWWFLGLNIAGYGAIALLRILKQPEQK